MEDGQSLSPMSWAQRRQGRCRKFSSLPSMLLALLGSFFVSSPHSYVEAANFPSQWRQKRHVSTARDPHQYSDFRRENEISRTTSSLSFLEAEPEGHQAGRKIEDEELPLLLTPAERRARLRELLFRRRRQERERSKSASFFQEHEGVRAAENLAEEMLKVARKMEETRQTDTDHKETQTVAVEDKSKTSSSAQEVEGTQTNTTTTTTPAANVSKPHGRASPNQRQSQCSKGAIILALRILAPRADVMSAGTSVGNRLFGNPLGAVLIRRAHPHLQSKARLRVSSPSIAPFWLGDVLPFTNGTIKDGVDNSQADHGWTLCAVISTLVICLGMLIGGIVFTLTGGHGGAPHHEEGGA